MDSKSKNADYTFQKGQQIDQYQVVGTLEQGGFSERYLGQHIQRRTSVAVEVLRPPLLAELQDSFLSQVRTLMTLDHPNILHIRDAGLEKHYPFLVTDYIAHFTLRGMYPQGSVQPVTKLLPHLKQIASALQYAHSGQILHGDIRPENIWLDENKQLLLNNFLIEAIAQNRERLHYQKSAVAQEAIAYTAPERIQGKPGPASDQYALAIVVYELLSGAPPFSGSYLEIADQQVRTPPPPLQSKVAGISPRVNDIVMTALEKDPTRRFNTVLDFVSALGQEYSTQPRPIPGRRTPPPVPRAVIQNMVPQSPPPVQPVPAPATSRMPPTAPSPVVPPSPAFMPATGAIGPSGPVAPLRLPPPTTPPPAIADSPPAPRRQDNTVTRRAFAVGLVGLAAVGGATGWYFLSKKLAPAPPPASAQDTTVLATPTRVSNTNALIFTGHLAGVNALVWSPDGKQIASASDDKFVQIFDASSGQRKLIYSGHTQEVAAVAWSPNGRLLASGGQDSSVQVWEAASGKKLFTYKGHLDRVNALSWSQDSRLLASGSEDRTVQVWNAVNGDPRFNFLGHTAGVLCVMWQPDNSSVASGSWDGTLRDWATVQHGNHFDAGEQIFSYGGHGKNEVYGLAWSPDGNFIVSVGADQTAQISNGDNGTPRPPFFTDHQSKKQVNPVRSVSWSPDGNFIASGDSDGNVFVWRVAGRKTVFVYRGHKGAVNAVAWSPDGKNIASASTDATVHVWQPA